MKTQQNYPQLRKPKNYVSCDFDIEEIDLEVNSKRIIEHPTIYNRYSTSLLATTTTSSVNSQSVQKTNNQENSFFNTTNQNPGVSNYLNNSKNEIQSNSEEFNNLYPKNSPKRSAWT
jgi:hypothetical protein